MENTKENKLKFFAQYWGYKYKYITDHGTYYGEVGEPYHYHDQIIKHDILYVLLKNINNITDNDAILLGWKSAEEFLNMSSVARDLSGSYKDFDLLRSLGYFIPYLDLTTEEAIKYGWFKYLSK